MCGIVAVLSPRPLERALLNEMRDRIAHRGPDGGKAWIGETPQGHVGLAHRRLSIIDLSEAADQPMWTCDRSLALVYNGEIYNYVELRKELEALGARFATRSDTEVLLHAYATWGLDCLPRLNGMFAFVIWDARRNELVVARDRFGEKPLFAARLRSGGIAFASEMKALFAHPEVVAVPDEDAVAEFAAGRYLEHGPRTMFRGVERVPAAHAIVLAPDGDTVCRKRYWAPDYSVREHAAGAGERFAELLDRSVRMRLRSDVPVGTSLSGGLDSSTIVAMIAGMRDVRDVVTQNTFTARFDEDPTMSEGRYADLVVAATKVHAHFVTPSPEGLTADLEALHWHQEEPFSSASIYLQWCVMRLAREHATTVLLDGQGADEVLGGYQYWFPAYQLDLLERGRLVRLVRDTRAFSRRLRAATAAYADSRRRFDDQAAYGVGRLLRQALRPPRLDGGPLADGIPDTRRGGRFRRRRAEALQYDTLPVLLRYADRNGMAFSRETRFPFLDHELVDWAIALPDTALIENGWQKSILRGTASRLLPAEVAWRADKVGYAAPLDAWLRGSLGDWARAALFDGALDDVPGFDRAAVDAQWAAHKKGEANLSWALWRWISLGEWLRLARNDAWSRARTSSLAGSN